MAPKSPRNAVVRGDSVPVTLTVPPAKLRDICGSSEVSRPSPHAKKSQPQSTVPSTTHATTPSTHSSPSSSPQTHPNTPPPPKSAAGKSKKTHRKHPLAQTSPAPSSPVKDDADADETAVDAHHDRTMPSSPLSAGAGAGAGAQDAPSQSETAVSTPATDLPVKKGVKRGAATALGDAKAKRPPSKKKARVDDGSDISLPKATNTAQKLGPKAALNAINAGLRALDRSGKPCRKWSRGAFTLKSFTGVSWDIPRWTAPPRPRASTEDDEAIAAADTKEHQTPSKKSKSSGHKRAASDAHGTPPPPPPPAESARTTSMKEDLDLRKQSTLPAIRATS